MKSRTQTPVVILALNIGSVAADLHAISKAGLGKQYIKSVEGSYQGETEPSYVIDVGHKGRRFGELNENVLNSVLRLAEAFNQESVLFLGYNRTADLIYCNSREVVNIGNFKAVSQSEALSLEGWTRDGSQYYTVK